MVKDFLAFRSISSGRRLRVLSQLRELVGGDDPVLVADIDAAEAANKHSRATDTAWKKQGRVRRRKGRTSELDPALEARHLNAASARRGKGCRHLCRGLWSRDKDGQHPCHGLWSRDKDG